ncbi:hypothetical protein [Candidatus Odyssella thessalonicensis]|uniref:hypothetical protein n=1 Tax=Candidatus Odyssella thessalonicensis TaxID=84647 RepID=UPI000225B223|nr:hypothetical protein [Candidatus Odyssella thessalonicensis]
MSFRKSYSTILLFSATLLSLSSSTGFGQDVAPSCSTSGFKQGRSKEEHDPLLMVHSLSSAVQNASPPSSLAREILWGGAQSFTESIKTDGKKLYQTYHQFRHKGLESLVTDSLEAYMKSFNKHYLSRHIKNTDPQSDEFNIEALRPLVEELRNSMSFLIYKFCLKQPFIDSNGKPIYLDKSVFRCLAEKVIPDIPVKGALISLLDFGPVNSYLQYHVDEMIINFIISLHHKAFGQSIKGRVEDIIGPLISHSQSYLYHVTGDGSAPLQKASLPCLAPETESDKEVKAETGLNEAEADFISITVIDTETKGKEREDLSTTPLETEKVASIKLPKEGGYQSIWEYFRPQMQYFLRQAFTKLLTTTSEKVINKASDITLFNIHENQRIIDTTKLFGASLAGTAGLGVGAAIGYPVLLGSPLAFMGLCTGQYIAAQLVTSFSTSLTKVVKDRIIKRFNNLMEYYSYTIIPLTREEHVLYNLNPEPSAEEKIIYAEDYDFRTRLSERSFIGELGKRIFFRKDLDVSEEDADQEKSLEIKIILGELAAKQGGGQSLTPRQQALLNNIVKYPSFKLKAKEIEFLKACFAKTEATLTEASKIEAENAEAIKELTAAYQIYGVEIPNAFASAYQILGHFNFSNMFRYMVDFTDVKEIIALSLRSSIHKFSSAELQLLQCAAKDDTLLSEYLKGYVNGKAQPETYEEAEAVLRDSDLFTGLIKAYIEAYKTTYIDDINLLKASFLAYKLEDAEIINLHQRMTGDQLQQHVRSPMIRLEEARKPELELLKKKILIFTKGSELELIRLHARSFIYADPEFFEVLQALEEYREIPLSEAILGKYGPETQKHEEIRLQIDKTKTRYPSISEVDIQHAYIRADNFKEKILPGLNIFKKFRGRLRRVLDNTELRSRVYSTIQTYLFEKLLQPYQETSREDMEIAVAFAEGFELMGKTSNFYGEEDDSTTFYLAEAIQGSELNNRLDRLSEEDLIKIHTCIHENKGKVVQDLDAVSAASSHLAELIHFKNGVPDYKDKLFYGYSEIFDLVQQQNTDIIEAIKSQAILRFKVST